MDSVLVLLSALLCVGNVVHTAVLSKRNKWSKQVTTGWYTVDIIFALIIMTILLFVK